MRHIWLAAFAGLLLAGLGYAANTSQAREDATHGAARPFIGYRFEGEYRGAWRDSRDAWNRIARRRGLPELVRARDDERTDLLIVSTCRPVGEVTAGYREAVGIIYVNRCTRLDRIERRKVYSHELGHVYDLEHRPGGVMPAWLEHQRAVYPTRDDARRAVASYDGI